MEKRLSLSRTLLFVLCFIFSTFSLSAQQKISGKVVDESKLGMPGVSIKIVGSNTGATTDLNGNFSMVLPDGKTTLQFSFMGYKTQTINVSGKKFINVTMEESSKSLQEVVVVGMGTQKRNTITAAVSTVNKDAINSRPVTDVTSVLQGNVVGLNMSTSSTESGSGGELGGSIKFDIRGIGSINGGEPYVLVDGVEQVLQNVNPADIESISVLKDASAAAVYGARAAYGVVLVTTKSGLSGKVKINYNGSVGSSFPINMPRMMNSIEFAEYINAYQLATGGRIVFNEDAINNMKGFQNNPYSAEFPGVSAGNDNTYWRGWQNQYGNTDWFDYYFKDYSIRHNHNLNISGGSDKVRFYIGTGYNYTGGLMDKVVDDLKKYNLNTKLEIKSKDWLKINLNNNITLINVDRPLPNMSILYHEFARSKPNMVTKLPIDGVYNVPDWDFNLYMKEMSYSEMRLSDAMSIGLTFTPVKGWDILTELKARMDYQNAEFIKKQPFMQRPDGNIIPVTKAMAGFNPPGTSWNKYDWNTYYRRNDFGYYISPNIMTSYTNQWDAHYFKAMVGFQSELQKDSYLLGYKGGVLSPNTFSFSNASGEPNIDEDRTHWATMGFYTKLNYNYKNKYFVEISGRYDGSSRFAPSHRWGLFPSISLGYDIAREEYFSNLNLLVSQLKIRASYGSLGNQNGVGLYRYYGFMNLRPNASNAWLLPGVSATPATGVIALTPNQVSDNVTWETVDNANIGLDITAFNDRFSMTLDLYQRVTKDMVGPAEAIPMIGGLSADSRSKVNNSTLRNRGWELSMNWHDEFKNGFRYSIGGNISDYKAVVTKYNNPEGIIKNNHTGLTRNKGYYEGMDIGEIWGYQADDLFITNQEVDKYLKNVDMSYFKPSDQWQRGDLKYVDTNGDGIISPGDGTIHNHGDLKIIGNTTPRYSYGINLKVGYKGFDLTALIQGVGKRDYPIAGSTYMFNGNENFFKEHLDYYNVNNPSGYLPRLSSNKSTDYKVNTGYNTTRYLLDVSYMRLKNIMLSYTFSESLLKHIKISNLKVYLTADNLFTFDKLPHFFDPETINQVNTWAGGSNDTAPGLTSPMNQNGNGKVYPLNRSFVFGIDFSF